MTHQSFIINTTVHNFNDFLNVVFIVGMLRKKFFNFSNQSGQLVFLKSSETSENRQHCLEKQRSSFESQLNDND